jgi:hypothetical protein
MSKIKLFKAGELSDGTQRLQSQLLVGTDTADFVMGTDGVLRCWGNGDGGFGFYEYTEPFEIVSNKSDMMYQEL